MNSQSQPSPTSPTSSESQSTSLPPRRSSRVNALFASIRGRVRWVLFLCIFLLFGFLLGIISIFVLLFAISPDNPTIANPSGTGSSDIVVQVGRVYITHIVSNALQSSGLPGTIQNVQVTLASGDSATITGTDQLSILGTRHFTVVIQPYIASCQVNVHVLHVDLGGIPVTAFATLFEGKINSQIKVNTSNLPGGFTYCASNVRTDPQGVFVTYSATPVTVLPRPLFANAEKTLSCNRSVPEPAFCRMVSSYAQVSR